MAVNSSLILLLAIGLADSISIKPYTAPLNYPNYGQPTPAAASSTPLMGRLFGEENKPRDIPPLDPKIPWGYEKTFPVVNVRYAYPPSAIDARRRLAVKNRQADIVTLASKVSLWTESDEQTLLLHMQNLQKIAGYLLALPKSLKNGIQNYYLNELGRDLTERGDNQTLTAAVSATSFLEDNPQINISIEDNTGAPYSEATDTTPNESIQMVQELGTVEKANLQLYLDILSTNLQSLSLIFDNLISPIETTATAIQNLQKQQKRDIKRMSLLQSDVKRMSLLQKINGVSPSAVFPNGPPSLLPHFTSLDQEMTASLIPSPTGLVPIRPLSNVTSIGPPTPNYVAPNGLNLPLVMELRMRVMEGGREGAKALAAIIDLWNEQAGARDVIRKTAVVADCKLLIGMAKVPDYIKNLAGSLITLITGTPYGSSVPDFNSGGYGHVNVVLPRPSRVYLADKETALAQG